MPSSECTRQAELWQAAWLKTAVDSLAHLAALVVTGTSRRQHAWYVFRHWELIRRDQKAEWDWIARHIAFQERQRQEWLQ